MALSIIICEGKTDAILISYFLIKQYGVNFSEAAPPVKLPIQHKNQSIKWYSIKENNKPSIAILGAGGIDNIPKTLCEISEINRNASEKVRFTKIALYFDTDTRKKTDCKELFCNWLTKAGYEYEKDKANLDNWFEASITGAFTPHHTKGVKNNEVGINIFGLALPCDSKGALETFLLNCLQEKGDEDNKIVTAAEKYINNIKDVSYLNKRRFPKKAALGSVLSVFSPDWVFTRMDDKLKLVEWENITDFSNSYKKLQFLTE